jgi:hypothetical protein
MPVVLMKILSTAPLGTTLVSPVTMSTPGRACGSAMDSTMRTDVRPWAALLPMMKPQVSTVGAWRHHGQSFTVPCTGKRADVAAGKERRVQVKVSVLTATLPPTESTAPSFMRAVRGCRNA